MQFFRRRTVEVTPSLSHSRARDMNAHAREISDGATLVGVNTGVNTYATGQT
jgi:hypothetical protein